MKKISPLFFLLMLVLSTAPVFASTPVFEVEGAPLRYAFVEGDANKFREQKWMREEYAGGVESFEYDHKDVAGGWSVRMDGHAIVQDNDYEGNLLIKNPDLGYVKIEYQEFSKFYDDTGGVFYPFSVLRVNSLGRDLELEIGHFRVEAGLTIEDIPHITFAYERHFKDGEKSRLTWGAVREGAVTKNIAPSFQNIDEIVDSVEIEVSHTLKGVEISNRTEWEWLESELVREEQSLSTTATASDKKIRVQVQQPESRLFTNTATAGRWFREDTVFSGMAYNFLHMSNNEIEDIFEMNATRALFNFGNPKQIRNARADSNYDAHAWVANFAVLPWQWLNINTKMRAEGIRRSGNSTYPQDTTAGVPDGIINTTEISQVDNKLEKLGESISIRFTKIPRTALYNEFEFEQVRNWLGEDRTSLAGQSAASAGEMFSRETITKMYRGIWTLGGQFVPANFVNLTAHFRINRNSNDYDDIRETNPAATGAKSAFFDAMNIQSEEFSTRATFKPVKWLRPSVRYQFEIRDYMTRAENQDVAKAQMDGHIFTFDVTVQPVHNLLWVTGFSPQYAWVETASSDDGAYGGVPRFQANNYNWFSNANYEINEKVGVSGGVEHSFANNYNDNTDTGLPLAADYRQFTVSMALNWAITKMVGLEMGYDFYYYAANELVESGDYDANLIWLKTTFNWA